MVKIDDYWHKDYFIPYKNWGMNPKSIQQYTIKEKKLALKLLDKIKNATDLSDKFKKNFEFCVNNKCSTWNKTIHVLPNYEDLPIFEHQYLELWAKENNITWDWPYHGHPRIKYHTIYWGKHED